MPMSRRGPTIGWPNKVIVPAVLGISPASNLSSVLLPHPLGPTTVTNSALSTVRSSASRASTEPPSRVSYILEIRSHRIAGCDALTVAARTESISAPSVLIPAPSTCRPRRVARYTVAKIERRRQIDARRRHHVIDQHVLAERVHGSAAGVGMETPAGAQHGTRDAVGGERHAVGARAADDRRGAASHHGRLRGAKRLDDRQPLVDRDGRIGHVDVQRGLGRAGPIGKSAKYRP